MNKPKIETYLVRGNCNSGQVPGQLLCGVGG